jgi:hypothetical protein
MSTGEFVPGMSERHPVKDSRYMKAIRDVHSAYQEVSLKIKNNRPLIPHTAVVWHMYVRLSKLVNLQLEPHLRKFRPAGHHVKKMRPTDMIKITVKMFDV